MELNFYTAPFKNTKFDMRDAYSSEKIQKAMFKMGFRFAGSQSGERRAVLGYPFKSFYIDEDLRINGSMYTIESGCGMGGRSPRKFYKEVTPLEILEASKLFLRLKGIKQRKRQVQKQIDRRKAREAAEDAAEAANTVSLETMMSNIVRDAGGVEIDKDGWIVHNPVSGALPVPGAIEAKFRDGEVWPAIDVGSWDNFPQLSRQVVGYKVAPVMKVGSLSSIGGDVGQLTLGSIAAPIRMQTDAPPAVWAEVGSVTDYGDGEQPDTNPKRQYGLTSIPLDMWSPLASAYGALGLYNGSLKYGKANFANTKVEASIYIAAAQRHLAAWAAGEEFDPADGVPNLGGVLANIAILLESRAAGMLIDDRLLMSGYLKERDNLKVIVKQLQELHAGKTPKHYDRTN